MTTAAEAPQQSKEDTKGFSKGLEKVIAGQSSICLIVGDKGQLYYRGYSIEDLSEKSTFEEVTYLLLKGKLPTQGELTPFKKELITLRELSPEVLEILRRLPKDTHPMAALRTGLSSIAHFDPRCEDKSKWANDLKAMNLVAKTPVIVAAFERIRMGLDLVSPNPSLDHAANFLYMLRGRTATSIEARVLDQYLILLAEHSFNASTFTARVCASTLSDMYSAIVAGVISKARFLKHADI